MVGRMDMWLRLGGRRTAGLLGRGRLRCLFLFLFLLCMVLSEPLRASEFRLELGFWFGFTYVLSLVQARGSSGWSEEVPMFVLLFGEIKKETQMFHARTKLWNSCTATTQPDIIHRRRSAKHFFAGQALFCVVLSKDS